MLVQPQIEGQATEELFVEVGDQVEAGQVLARLSDSALTLSRSQLVASLSAAEAAVAQANAQVAEAEASMSEVIRRAIARGPCGTRVRSRRRRSTMQSRRR